MNSCSQMTYILLERGVEDKELVSELNRIISELNISSIKTLYTIYPTIYELKHNLEREIRLQEIVED